MLKLKGKKIAILATDGFEQSELERPKADLEAAGAIITIVSPLKGKITGWKDKNWGDKINVDQEVGSAKSDDFDALVIPGGVINPDKLRIIPSALTFIKGFVKSHKPIGAICHGPWPLIDAEAVKGKKMTSWISLKTDLENAGAKWVDEEVVVDGNLITSRKPDDIPAFSEALIKAISKG